MGSVYARCACSYQAEVFLGSVRANYLHSFEFPHICEHCREVVSVQMCCKKPVCPSCGKQELISLGYEVPPQQTGLQSLIEKGSETLKERLAETRVSREGKTLIETLNFCSHRSWALTEGPHPCPSCSGKILYLKLGALYD